MPGVFGQLEARDEFERPGHELRSLPAAIYLPSATGGTQAGLVARTRPAAMPDASSACSSPGRRPSYGRLCVRWSTPCGRGSPLTSPTTRIVFDESQIGDGYGRPTTAAAEAADLLARTEAILVDPIYTAKALAALIAAVRDGRYDDRSIVFWHAGGTLGLLEPMG